MWLRPPFPCRRTYLRSWHAQLFVLCAASADFRMRNSDRHNPGACLRSYIAKSTDLAISISSLSHPFSCLHGAHQMAYSVDPGMHVIFRHTRVRFTLAFTVNNSGYHHHLVSHKL
jgi:hypothetical protein